MKQSFIGLLIEWLSLIAIIGTLVFLCVKLAPGQTPDILRELTNREALTVRGVAQPGFDYHQGTNPLPVFVPGQAYMWLTNRVGQMVTGKSITNFSLVTDSGKSMRLTASNTVTTNLVPHSWVSIIWNNAKPSGMFTNFGTNAPRPWSSNTVMKVRIP